MADSEDQHALAGAEVGDQRGILSIDDATAEPLAAARDVAERP